MIEKGKARPEFTQGPQGREVLWLAPSDPPAGLVTFLRSRGLELVSRDALTGATPLKLLQIYPGGPALARTPQLTGRRLAVMHPDPGCADALAQALRAKGAEVVVLSLNPASLERAETLDPDAVIMEASDFSGSCWEIVRALFRHPQLRFSTVLLATPEMLGSQPATALDIQHLCTAINDVAQTYEYVREQAKQAESFAFELDELGPSRCLRALLDSGRSMRALFTCGDTTIEIDLAEQIIVGAQSPAGAAPDAGLLGVHALNLLLAQWSAQVEVRSVDHPARTNVMAPLESALHMTRELVSTVRANNVRSVGEPANDNTEMRAKTRAAATRNRTLVGVPAVQVDPNLMGGKTKPGAAPPPATKIEAKVEAKPEPKVEAKPETMIESQVDAKPRTSMPARPHLASIPAPATKRTLPPAKPKGTGAPPAAAMLPAAPPPAAAMPPAPPQPAAAMPPASPPVPMVAPPTPPAAPPRALSVPPALPASKAPPAPIFAAPESPFALDVVVEAVAPAPTPEPARAISSQSALETLKLPAYTPDTDAELVRAFRARPALAPSRRTRWIAAGACAFGLIGWLLVRGGGDDQPSAASATVSTDTPALVPPARAAEPPIEKLEKRAPAAPAAASPTRTPPTAKADSEPADEKGGSHSRESGRKAGLLCNEANALRGKKMLPSARVKYLEALRVYPDYPRALSGLAQIALSTNSAAEAVNYAKQLVAARAGQAPYHLLLGDAYRAANDEKHARAAYQTARRLGSKAAKERLAE